MTNKINYFQLNSILITPQQIVALSETQVGLKSLEEVLAKYPNLHKECKLSELAVQLTRESFFGEKVMSESTVYGARGYKKQPPPKVQNLKNTIFLLCPHYAYKPTSSV